MCRFQKAPTNIIITGTLKILSDLFEKVSQLYHEPDVVKDEIWKTCPNNAIKKSIWWTKDTKSQRKDQMYHTAWIGK